jgi:hypothetical protein
MDPHEVRAPLLPPATAIEEARALVDAAFAG